MNVHGSCATVCSQVKDLCWRYSPQRVNGNACRQAGLRMIHLGMLNHGLLQMKNRLRRRGKSSLHRIQTGLAKALVHVKGWQQGEANADIVGSANQSPSHFYRVSVIVSLWTPVQIVKLTDVGITTSNHFAIKPGCNGFQMIRAYTQGHAVHAIAPTPEIIARLRAEFCQASHRPLKGMAVGVYQTRYDTPKCQSACCVFGL